MMTVSEVSRLTGVSIRTLQFYDKIGLLKPTAYTESGYRKYDDAALELLQQILLFRELEFPLKEIKRILCSPDYDKNRALEQQIELLLLRREHIDNLIALARGIKVTGGKQMGFEAFDKTKLDAYAKQAKESWGKTDAYKEFEQKNEGRSQQEQQALGGQLMDLFARLGELKELGADAPTVQAQIRELQSFITEHYYTCTDAILSQLGQMYAAGGEFTANIDAAGGPGTAEFANEAIRIYCRK